MTGNVGGAGKAIHILVGITLLVAAFFHVATGNWTTAAYMVGGIALVTGVFGFCPARAIFKACTVKRAPSK